MADLAPLVVILGVQRRADQLDQRAVGALSALKLQASLVLALDLGHPLGLLQLGQALALAPGEVLAAALGLVRLGLLEQVGVALLQAHPLPRPREETEPAPAALAPLVVGRQPEAALVEDALDVGDHQAELLEGEERADVGLGRDVAAAVLVGADADVAPDRVGADVGLERLDLELARTPAHPRRGQHAAVHVEPVVKAAAGVQPDDRALQERLQPVEVVVGLGQLFVRVAEDVLKLRDLAAHEDCQRGAVLAAAEVDDVAAGARSPGLKQIGVRGHRWSTGVRASAACEPPLLRL